MNPKAAFIIPVKDGEAYLSQAIQSCRDSDYSNIEIVVVDDCSSDQTSRIIKFHADKDTRIKHITHDKPKGRSAARNTGIESTKAEFLMMMDHDDIANRARAGTIVKFFQRYDAADIVYSECHVIDSLGSIIGRVEAIPFSFDNIKKTKMAYIVHSTMAFRRNVFDKVKYTEGEYSDHGIDDWKFQIDAAKAGFKFRPIFKCLGKYRYIPKVRDEEAIIALKDKCLN